MLLIDQGFRFPLGHYDLKSAVTLRENLLESHGQHQNAAIDVGVEGV